VAEDTIPYRLIQQGLKRPQNPAYYVREGGTWKSTNWGTYASEVAQAGRGLIALGFQPKQTACILGFNRPEWVIMDLAAMGAGGAPAGIYTTSSPAEVKYIVTHADAPIILCEDEEQWKKVEAERANMPSLKHVVMMKGAPSISDDMVLSWDEFMAKGDSVDEQAYLDRVEALEPDALATLIYTSGTTGPPKGVMLSHRNLSWTAGKAIDIVETSPNDCSLSYLPLSHIAEQMFTIHTPITTGSRIYFAESIDAVPENLKEVQPTVFFGVPRIWEKFHAGIQGKLKEATGIKAKLVDWAMKVGLEANREPDGPKGLQYTLSGIGMHPKANKSADRFDDFTVPRFLDYLELNFLHPEFFMPKFTKDIVPTQEEYTWEFEVASNLQSPEVTLKWENSYFGNNDRVLMLQDLQNHQTVNMQEDTAYTFSVTEDSRKFKIFYGSTEVVRKNMLPENIVVGNAYPNPVTDQFKIPVILPDGYQHAHIQLEIYDATGSLVKTSRWHNLPTGYNSVGWNIENNEYTGIQPGLYFYRLTISGQTDAYNGRILIR